jgi:biopolymer transport protein ExbD
MDDDAKAYDDLNVTPLLDLSFTLLIIFIIMTTAAVQGTKVDLPRASKAENLGKPKTKAITVNNEGRIFLDTLPVTIEELEQRLLAEKAENPDLPIVLRGDDLTQYQSVMQVLDVLGRVGLDKVGLATQPKR